MAAVSTPVTVRLVSNVDRVQPISEAWAARYGHSLTKGSSREMPYKQKMIFAFYKSGGDEVAFFSLIVVEYGPWPPPRPWPPPALHSRTLASPLPIPHTTYTTHASSVSCAARWCHSPAALHSCSSASAAQHAFFAMDGLILCKLPQAPSVRSQTATRATSRIWTRTPCTTAPLAGRTTTAAAPTPGALWRTPQSPCAPRLPNARASGVCSTNLSSWATWTMRGGAASSARAPPRPLPSASSARARARPPLRLW